MDLVQIKIKKDENTISYIKIIREFDKTIPISEIKRSIETNDFVYGFDLDRSDWLYLENMTEYKWHRNFVKFLKKLKKAGADLEIYKNGRLESMQLLENWIHTRKEISEECERYPD